MTLTFAENEEDARSQEKQRQMMIEILFESGPRSTRTHNSVKWKIDREASLF